jgi:hypothetical protein
MPSFREQIRNNSVALISLGVALSSLAYNTWRNERTEHNRNVRVAGFEVLLNVSELQRVVFFSHYDRDRDVGNPRNGWVHVLTIRDLAEIMPEPVPTQAAVLQKVWDENWDGLGSQHESVERIDASLDDMREATLATLRALD